MMPGTRLLAFARRWFPPSTVSSVFEPLVADWQRELDEAAGASPVRRAMIVLRGLLAFASTLALCGVRHALTEGTGMWKYSLMAIAAAMGLGIASEMAIVSARTPADFPPDLLLDIAVRSALVSAFATAMLPALFLLRRDPRTMGRSAMLWLSAGALLVATAIVMLPAPKNYQLSAEQNERVYQRALANDRAGRYQYPGTSRRQRREPTTPESRRSSYDKFLACCLLYTSDAADE